jgi:hypothetical protein
MDHSVALLSVLNGVLSSKNEERDAAEANLNENWLKTNPKLFFLLLSKFILERQEVEVVAS